MRVVNFFSATNAHLHIYIVIYFVPTLVLEKRRKRSDKNIKHIFFFLYNFLLFMLTGKMMKSSLFTSFMIRRANTNRETKWCFESVNINKKSGVTIGTKRVLFMVKFALEVFVVTEVILDDDCLSVPLGFYKQTYSK